MRSDVDHEQLARHIELAIHAKNPRYYGPYPPENVTIVPIFEAAERPLKLRWPGRFWRWVEGLRWPWGRAKHKGDDNEGISPQR